MYPGRRSGNDGADMSSASRVRRTSTDEETGMEESVRHASDEDDCELLLFDLLPDQCKPC